MPRLPKFPTGPLYVVVLDARLTRCHRDGHGPLLPPMPNDPLQFCECAHCGMRILSAQHDASNAL